MFVLALVASFSFVNFWTARVHALTVDSARAVPTFEYVGGDDDRLDKLVRPGALRKLPSADDLRTRGTTAQVNRMLKGIGSVEPRDRVVIGEVPVPELRANAAGKCAGTGLTALPVIMTI